MSLKRVEANIKILFFLLIVQTVSLYAQNAGVPAQQLARSRSSLLNLPLSFERQGEGAGERYVAEGKGYRIGLDKGRAVIGLPKVGKTGKDALVTLDFVGGKEVNGTPEEELPGKVNRYTGNDPRQWKAGLATFGKVAYRDVYPGIDVVYYGNQRGKF